MAVICGIVDYGSSFTEALLLYFLAAYVFRKKEVSIKKLVLFGLIMAALSSMCGYITVFSYISMGILIFCDVIILIGLFQVNFMESFAVVLLYNVCLFMTDFFLATVISRMTVGEQYLRLIKMPGKERLVFVLINLSLWYLAYLIIRRILYRREKKQHYFKGMLLLACAGMMVFVYLSYPMLSVFYRYPVKNWLVLISLLGCFAFILSMISYIKESRMQIEYDGLRNSLLEKNYQVLSELYEKNAQIYHDLNKHLNILYQLLQRKDIDAAKEYITTVSKPIQELAKTIWTGIDTVDVIINSEMERIKKLGMSYDIEVEYPNHARIKASDLCTILSNLLDNAIEAAERVSDREKIICLHMRYVKQMILIKISNPCIETVRVDCLNTTKADKLNHGWGIKNVAAAVEKYGGEMEFQILNHEFIVFVTLFL